MGNYEKAEGILDRYSRGKLSATEAQKELKKFGYGARLRGKSNVIPVFPLEGGDGFDVELAKGGALLKKQMDLFEPVERGFDEGGLMDEGGSVDPISGNDVPVGSTQEEVRDDIPAQLSEGEFVLPADVVRYHGLEKIMELRDEAKAGLQKMEDMGQMGNSEEATLADDVPFSMDDLELEDDGVAEYQVGGYVPPQNVGFQQSQFAGYQPQITQPMTQPFTTPAYQAPSQQFTPTQAGAVPTFSSFVTPQTATYYHSDGRTMQIPVDANGKPLIPVPAGFTATAPTAAAPATPTTTPTYQAPQQTGGDDSGPSPEDLQRQEEYKQTVNKRMEAAEQLGYTNKQNAIEAVLPFVVPGGSVLMPKPDRGTVLVDGTIADGAGGSFDPISGEKVGYAGGILGTIAGGLGLGEKGPEISEQASKMGLSPASMEGLKTIKGEESIQDLLEGRVDTSASKSAAITNADIDAAVKAGLGTREEIMANIASADAQPTKATSTPMDAAETVGVETARVTEKGGVAEVAEKAISPNVQSAMDKIQESINGQLGSRAGQASDKSVMNYLDNIISQATRPSYPQDAKGDTILDALDTPVTLQYTPPENEDAAVDDIIAAQRMKERLQSKSERRDTTKEKQPDVTSARVSAAQRRTADIPRQTAAERADEEAAEQEGGTAFDDYGKDFDRNFSNYSNRGYSRSAAREAAANKTDADREAREQTGNSKSSAVTSSSGKAVRSSSGSVVTSTPDDDDGSSSKIVCTAMNNAYGFGSFRQTIWLKHSRDMHPAYQKGYHRIFKPLIKFAYKGNKWYNIAVRKTLEGIARRRTADIWMQQRGKRHLVGAIERAILEPICYIVGKIK